MELGGRESDPDPLQCGRPPGHGSSDTNGLILLKLPATTTCGKFKVNGHAFRGKEVDELELIEAICRWVLIGSAVMLAYSGFMLFLKMSKERKWGKEYRPSLEQMSEDDAGSHATFVELKYRAKKHRKKS